MNLTIFGFACWWNVIYQIYKLECVNIFKVEVYILNDAHKSENLFKCNETIVVLQANILKILFFQVAKNQKPRWRNRANSCGHEWWSGNQVYYFRKQFLMIVEQITIRHRHQQSILCLTFLSHTSHHVLSKQGKNLGQI